MDAPNFLRLLADGQLLIYVADAVSTSIRYLWLCTTFFKRFLLYFTTETNSSHSKKRPSIIHINARGGARRAFMGKIYFRGLVKECRGGGHILGFKSCVQVKRKKNEQNKQSVRNMKDRLEKQKVLKLKITQSGPYSWLMPSALKRIAATPTPSGKALAAVMVP